MKGKYMAGDGLWYIIGNFGLQGFIAIAIFTFTVDCILKKFVESENVQRWIFMGVAIVIGWTLAYFSKN